MNLKSRFNRLDKLIKEDKIIRHQWKEEDRVCLLAALSPEVAEHQDSSFCPSTVVPLWLACLTPAMDDNGTLAEWTPFVKRYASVVRKAAITLDAGGWRRAEYRVRKAAVEEAMAHTKDPAVLKACETVIGLHNRTIKGEDVSEEERSAAKSAAESAAKSAAKSAAESAAWSAAESAAESAAKSAAWSAAESAAKSAAESAAKSAAWSAAESAAKSAAESAAWDRLNTKILDCIEAEIPNAPARKSRKKAT